MRSTAWQEQVRGRAVVGEIKKQRYVYYHCTGYADKCRAIRRPVAASMCGRKRSRRSSPNSSAG
jgi:hypothetical protein